ncbi:MAG: metal ABC transporter permease [Acidobacteriaceae bacterium]
MLESIGTYLSYDFVQHALIAGSLAGALSAVIGYFVVIRRTSFAAHALAHIGFTGATGAALFAISPMLGMLAVSGVAGVMMGAFGKRIEQRDVAIGMTLSLALGVGLLFLALYRGFSGQASAILFGNIFGVSHAQIAQMIWLAAATLLVLFLLSRKLFFASIQPDLAEARGLSLFGLSIAFMLILAISVTLASQVVGILLVFALVIGPAGISARLARSFWPGMIGSIVIALFAVSSGILAACVTSLPPSFWITAVLFVLYILSELIARSTMGRKA